MKKVLLLGLPNPVRFKSKKYILETLYKRAKKNPFLSEHSYNEYLEFLKGQIEQFGDVKIKKNVSDKDIEEELYKSLKDIGWIKVFNSLVIGVLNTYTGIS